MAGGVRENQHGRRTLVHVPADNRWYSRAVVSELLRTTLKNMNMTWPPLEPEVDPDEVRRRMA